MLSFNLKTECRWPRNETVVPQIDCTTVKERIRSPLMPVLKRQITVTVESTTNWLNARPFSKLAMCSIHTCIGRPLIDY